jgi:hypothetical protein
MTGNSAVQAIGTITCTRWAKAGFLALQSIKEIQITGNSAVQAIRTITCTRWAKAGFLALQSIKEI